MSRLGARASTSKGNLLWFAPGAGVVARCFDSDEAKRVRGLVVKPLDEAAVSFLHLWGDMYTEDDVRQAYGSS